MKRNVMLTLSMALVAYVAAPAAAFATPIFAANIHLQLNDFNLPGASETFHSGGLGINTIPSATVSIPKASATAYVQKEVLGASAAAQSLIGDTRFVSATATADFRDTLILESDSLAVGTPVQLLLTLDLDVVLNSTESAACGGYGQGVLDVFLAPGLGRLAFLESFQVPAPCQTITPVPTIVTAKIGDEIVTVLTLNVVAAT